MNSKVIITIFLGAVFFIFGVLTLPGYGINWDTINHLPRGQAYLHYFLTGKKDFRELPAFVPYWQKPESLTIDADIPSDQVPRRSFYQSDGTTFAWFMVNDGGHPPLSDILASVTNYILFQKLGLINDIDAYRVYGIFLAASLVALVFWWTSSIYGKVAGLVAAISLATYPLFWSESHFNTEKDIPEAVYLSFFIFSLWKAFNKFSLKWMLMSGIFWGLALGTKFNAVFVPFIVIPWLGYLAIKNRWHKNVKERVLKNKKFLLSSLFAPVIGLVILIVSWPFLWADPISRLRDVVGYYQGIGLTTTFSEHYITWGGVNTYPIQAILYTTPIPVLILFALGIFYMTKGMVKKTSGVLALLLIWFVVTVGRVSWPGMSIYGGLRQIMEYMPAMAIIAGLGGGLLYQFFLRKLKYRRVTAVLVLLIFAPHLVKLVQIHPNENVYFNELIGGLAGAKQKEFLYWGNSFGAAYRQGVVWLNSNVPHGGKVVMARELMPNIPTLWLRPDLSFHNSQRSGYLQLGEYTIGLTYQGTRDYSYYDGFLETFVNPSYEAKVDDVAVLKVWQNDKSKLAFDPKETYLKTVVMEKLESGLRFDLGGEYKLARLEIAYGETNCKPLVSGVVRISADARKWQTLVGVLPRYWRIGVLRQQPDNGKFIEPFYGQSARYIDLLLSPVDTCLKEVIEYELFYYDF